jgi:UDP-N-acetylglucosamine acyltransferase
MAIHSTAIIHPEAKISEEVEIGPYVCIEGPAEIGSHCVIESHAILVGAVRLGSSNRIGHGAIIGAPAQHLAFAPDHPGEVVIGNGNTIRELCTIHRSTVAGGATRMGDHNYLMAGAHLAHDVHLGSHITIANNALLGGHVQVGDRVFIGGGTVFHQHTCVGRLVITQGISGYSKDIPPFTVGAGVNTVAGLNAIGMRRSGMNAAQRQEIKSAFKLLYRSGLNVGQALAGAADLDWGPEAREFFDFVRAAKKRGICDLMDSSQRNADDAGEAGE